MSLGYNTADLHYAKDGNMKSGIPVSELIDLWWGNPTLDLD